MKRSITSASNLHRRAACPGSERLEKAYPQETQSEEATEGTLLHELMVHPDTSREQTPDHSYCLNFCRDTEDELLKKVFTDGKPKVIREVQLELDREVFGHADFIAVWKDHAIVLDYKFGRVAVDKAEENLQTRAYAVMVADKYGCDYVTAGIVQPRLSGDERVSLSMYGAADIEMSRLQIATIRKACENPDAPLRPEIAACRYCRAKVDCPALKEEVNDMVCVSPSSITTTNAAEFYRKAKLVEKHVDALKSAIYQTVSNAEAENRPVPGLRLKLGSEKRTITDAQKAFSVVGLDPSAFAACCTVKISALDAAFKDHMKLKAGEAKKALNTILTDAGCLTMKRSESSLELIED